MSVKSLFHPKSLFRTVLVRATLTASLGVAGAVGLAAAAQAAPLAPAPAGTLTGPALETVAYGCGPGFIPNRFGDCRPMYRPDGYYRLRPFYGSRPFYGPRYGYYRPRPRPPFGPYF